MNIIRLMPRFVIGFTLLLPVLARAQPGPLPYNPSNVQINGGTISGANASGANVTATGSTTARTLADRAAERLNVRDGCGAAGAVGDGVTDDSAAWAACIILMNTKNASSSGARTVVYGPPGNYHLTATHMPIISNGGGIIGDGRWKTIISVDKLYTGDVFSWSDTWQAGFLNTGTSSPLSSMSIAATVQGLTITGDRTAASAQNALVFYDHADFVYINDVDVFYMTRALYSGVLKNDTTAYMRESNISNFRVWMGGAAGIPAVEFTTQCSTGCTTTDASNEIDINVMAIYGPEGPGFVIRNADTGGTIRSFRVRDLRVEGAESNPNNVAADLMVIGDATMQGPLGGLIFTDCEIISPYSGYYALHILSPSAGGLASAPANVQWSGQIGQGAGAGGGVKVDSGKQLWLRFTSLSSAATNITVGPSTLIGSPLFIDGGGQEPTWTWSVDSTSLPYVRTPIARSGIPTPQSTNTFISAQIPDGTVNSGNTRGSNATDWQTVRFGATQVASGSGSVIGGGTNNIATNTAATVAGGNQNIANGFVSSVGGGAQNNASGSFSTVPGGYQATTRGQVGEEAYGSGDFVNVGDAQRAIGLLRGTGSSTTAIRVTSDGGAANGSNCVNIPINFGFGARISLHARDNTASGKDYDWVVPNAILTQDANAASTAVALGTPLILTRGTVTGAAVSATADTTNGCLNLSFTPPTGNTDTWHVVARVETVEVQ